MPVDILVGGIVTCIVCSLCGVACVANNKKNPRRGPGGVPFTHAEQMLAEQQQMDGMINPMELLMQEQLVQEKEETERLRNYIRRQKRAAADAILRQQAGLTLAPAPAVAAAPVAQGPIVQPALAMQGLPPRMVVCAPQPGCCGGAGMVSPFPQMPNPSMPPLAVPVYYLR